MAVLDWRMRHGPVSGPVHLASALSCTAAVGGLPAVALQPEIPLGLGAIGAAGICLWSAQAHIAASTVVYRMGTWLAGSFWLADVLTVGWSARSLFTLAGGAALAGVLGYPVTRRQRTVQQRQEESLEREAADYADQVEQEILHDHAEHWIRRIEKICKVKVRVLAIEPWIRPGPDRQPRQTGYTLELRLPADGSTWQDIDAHTRGLAAAEDLPRGCGIEVEEGASRQLVLVHVNTVDALRDDIPLPMSTRPRTVNDPFDLGVRRSGALAEIGMQQESVVIVGAKRSGKSTEIQTTIARLLECTDTLVCVIDKNGGGLAVPWLVPWANGEIENSPIYWVADTDEEAEQLTDWLIAVVEARKLSQAAAMRQANDDKVHPSARVPHIVLVTDEAGSLPSRITTRITDISDRGGASAVGTLTCALRPTSDYLPVSILTQAAVRIGMRVNNSSDLGHFYNWARSPDSADAPSAGYGFIGTYGSAPYVHKGYRTDPATIAAVARATGAYRPTDIEQETLDLLPPEIRRIGMKRWERTRHIRRAAATGEAAVPVKQEGEAPPTVDQRSQPHPRGMAGALEDMAAKRRQLEEAVAAAGGDQDGQTFEELAAELRSGVVPELVIRVLAAIGDAERMHTADIAEVLGVRKEALGSLLSQVGIRPLKNAFTIDGTSGRGYARADVEAGAERIRTGETAVPDEIARWRPPS